MYFTNNPVSNKPNTSSPTAIKEIKNTKSAWAASNSTNLLIKLFDKIN